MRAAGAIIHRRPEMLKRKEKSQALSKSQRKQKSSKFKIKPQALVARSGTSIFKMHF